MPAITLETFAKFGTRYILVDGVRWGRASRESHGTRGATFTFFQEGASGAIRDDKSHCPWEIHRVKAPYDQRIIDEAHKLIEVGKLRDPAIVRAEVDAARKKRDDVEDARKAARR